LGKSIWMPNNENSFESSVGWHRFKSFVSTKANSISHLKCVISRIPET
jgi:hypothetical protein